MIAFGALLLVHVRVSLHACVYIYIVHVCVCASSYIFVCLSSPGDATTYPCQAENTLIFPTLIAKREVERTERCAPVFVCVVAQVCVSGRGE